MTKPIMHAENTPHTPATLSPSRRAWLRFRANRLAYWSLMIFITLFGLSLVWLIYPRLDEQFAIIAEDQARKLAAADAVAETPPTA